jgi:ankyrin repeat protein
VLLEHGAPLDVRDNDKKTPLDLAFQKGKGSTTRLLLNLILSRGQTFSQKRYSLSTLSSRSHFFCRREDSLTTFSLGGQMGLDVSEGSQERASGPDAAGGIALSSYSNCAILWVLLVHIAAPHHQMKCSKSLNVNTQTLTGWTPLHIAVRNGQVRNSSYFAYRTLGHATNVTPCPHNTYRSMQLRSCCRKEESRRTWARRPTGRPYTLPANTPTPTRR